MIEETPSSSLPLPQRPPVRGRGPFVIFKEGNPNTDAPFTIRQGPTLEAIVEISKHPSVRDRFLDALRFVVQDDLDYVDVLLSFGAIEALGERNHLRKHWYPPKGDLHKPGVWWKDCQPIVYTVVNGLIAAFETAKNTGLPVAYYWMIVSDTAKESKPEQVVMRVYQSEDHILLMKITPPPPH